MKLSELTENDVIHIRTKKEAKEILKLLNKQGFRWCTGIKYKLKDFTEKIKVGDFYLILRKGEWTSVETERNIMPASKFLKSTPTKKELQAALSEVGEELAYLREEVKMIKKNSEIKEFNANIECDFENVKEGLPEKWSVLRTTENSKEINDWACREWGAGYYFHSTGYLNSDNSTSDSLESDYNEITFEQFKKYVRKEEYQPAPIDWSKAGQLVRAVDEPGSNAIFMVLGKGINDRSFTGICLIGDDTTHIGEYSNDWSKNDFRLYTEPVTLSN